MYVIYGLCRMTENYEPEMATEAEPVEEMTWNDYTVIQLKEELNMRGLETVGKKAELVARLEKYDSGEFLFLTHSVCVCVPAISWWSHYLSTYEWWIVKSNL